MVVGVAREVDGCGTGKWMGVTGSDSTIFLIMQIYTIVLQTGMYPLHDMQFQSKLISGSPHNIHQGCYPSYY